MTKQVVYQCLRMDFLTALEAITGPMGVAANTADHREAVTAFFKALADLQRVLKRYDHVRQGIVGGVGG